MQNETLQTLEIIDGRIGEAGFACAFASSVLPLFKPPTGFASPPPSVLFPFIEGSESLQSLVLRGCNLSDGSGAMLASVIKARSCSGLSVSVSLSDVRNSV
jgi:hypothetical protein